MINKIIRFFLYNRLITFLLIVTIIIGGIVVSPFGWDISWLPSAPVAVDALPDIGDNQQIVFTEWEGRSPQDVEDQITYPLTATLLGLPGVRDIRSSSMMGFSSITIIFDDDIDFYWARSRVLEKLNSVPPGLLPDGVKPAFGPDATALGQVFWYTIEGRDKNGNPAGGWDLNEIRSTQDFVVKYALSSVEGVAEVASIGGAVREYQVDVDPSLLKRYGISIGEVADAVRKSNRDVGAQTVEINQAEYLVRGLGYVKKISDIESAVIREINHVPVSVGQVAVVHLGPAPVRGALDKDGAEVAGGVVVSRHGANPMQVIQLVKQKINEIAGGLPVKTLQDGRESRLTIVPFYDRSHLINETLNTLNDALVLQVLITILVIIVMVYNLRASLVISSLLPLGILITFLAMKAFRVDANIVALSGIAIAIGTMVDVGIILCENIIKKMDDHPQLSLTDQIYDGAAEVSSAILTAVATTVISFLPVFSLQAAEGKLFGPLAFTKTFALIAALIVAILILPTLFYWLFKARIRGKKMRWMVYGLLLLVAVLGLITGITGLSWILLLFVAILILREIVAFSSRYRWLWWGWNHLEMVVAVFVVCGYLSRHWMPIGADRSAAVNFIFVAMLAAITLGFSWIIQFSYLRVLRWCLRHKKLFLTLPVVLTGTGVVIWLGFETIFGFVAGGQGSFAERIKTSSAWTSLAHTFPGIGKEFMPALDEGTFLFMPSSMPHSGVANNKKLIGQMDRLIAGIPEVEMTVGKLGRAETAMDPAPVSMFENVVNYKEEFASEHGKLLRFRTDRHGNFILTNGDTLNNDFVLELGYSQKDLIKDPDGKVFRNWRSGIKSPDDIWNEIIRVTKNIPGLTSPPKLQPIETRNMMLQTGMNAPMGIKIHGPDLKTIQDFGDHIAQTIRQLPGVKKEAVFAEKVVGKPYLQLVINRNNLGKYGLSVDDVQSAIEMSIGGEKATTTVEGRQRYAVRIRYPRELRDNPEEMKDILVSNSDGLQIPLSEVVTIQYLQGPQEIKSENTFLTSYVLFDKQSGFGEADVSENVLKTLESKINDGSLVKPQGVSFEMAGNYQNQLRVQKRLSLIIPVTLVIIFLILYLQFRSVSTSLFVFSSIALAFTGGFILLWLYSKGWFLDIDVFGKSMRGLFRVHAVHLSVAVWIGFIELFGLATDDGVLMATYLDQSFKRHIPATLDEVRQQVVTGAEKRIRPAVMTAATTIIALLPVLTSVGRGSDILIPLAIPAFGGMIMTSITFYIVPVLYAIKKERQFKKMNDEK